MAVKERIQLVISTCLFLVAAVFAISARDFPPRLAIVPVVSAAVVMFAALLDIARLYRRHVVIQKQCAAIAAGSEAVAVDEAFNLVSPQTDEELETGPIVAVLWFLVFMALIFSVGFLIAIPIYLIAFMRIQGGIAWRTIVVTLAITWAIVYGGFVVALNQRVYPGIF